APVRKVKIKDVSEERVFFVCDGRTLKNLDELAHALAEISDDVFRYHVNEEKNDFANWIRDVMNKQKLADKLFKTADKEKTKQIIIEFIRK
ncbi:MAG: DUF5752 family protein, partial [Chrysiogenales bacterium]